MDLLLLPSLGFAVLAALFTFFFGVPKALTLLLVTLVIAGFVVFFDSSTMFLVFLLALIGGAGFLAVAAGLGIIAGIHLKKRRYLFAVCMFIPFPLVMWNAHSISVAEKNETKLAHDFIMKNTQLSDLIGGPVDLVPQLTIIYNDSSRARHEYTITNNPALYAILDISRAAGKLNFRLSCVTTLPRSMRLEGKDDCSQSVIPLPKDR
jgi:hypothetical protein